MKNRRAFSLTELSIVLLVISALIAGIVKGGSMIQASRISVARNYTVNSMVPKIPGLIAWYETSLKESFKPSDKTDGAQISTWYDISPGSIIAQKNSLTRTASSAVTTEISGINKIPSVSFDGTGILNLNSFYQGQLSTYNSFFIVYRPIEGSSAYSKIILDAYSGTKAIGLQADKVGIWDTSIGGYRFTSTATNPISITGGANYILTIILNTTSSKVFQNSITNIAGGSNVAVISSAATTGLSIGGNQWNSANNNTYAGLVSEIIIYDRIVQANERREILGYLSKKYDIAIDDL